ncbi:MAG: dephospho-CoA kinase [Myxococcota bacterium]
MGRTRTLVVGLTGGIGSGKSRVADLLRKLGAQVECSDRIVRELQAPGGAALEAIASAFGKEYLQPSGELDREKLGSLVFSDARARRQLGEIVHPLVYGELERRLRLHREAGAPVVVLDIPLLLEGRRAGRGSGASLPFDLVVLVYADEETQIRRVMERDGLTQEAAESRVRAQMPIDRKRAMADVVIDNGGAWEETERRVRALYASWLNDSTLRESRG